MISGPKVVKLNNLGVNELKYTSYSHPISDGSSHTFIDQNVTTTGTPTFDKLFVNQPVNGNSPATKFYLDNFSVLPGLNSGLIKTNVGLRVQTDNTSIDLTEINSNGRIQFSSNFLGDGLTKGTSDFNVLTDNVSIEIDSDQLRVSSSALNPAGGLIGGSGVPISVLTDNVSLDINSDQIRLRSGALSGTGALIGGNGTPINVLTDNVSVEINSDQLRISSNVTSLTGGLTGGSGVPLSVLTDNTSIDINSDQIRLRSGALSGTGALIGGNGTPISVLTDNISVEINSDQLRISSNVTSLTGGLTGGSGVPLSVLTDNVSLDISSDQIRLRSGALSETGALIGGNGTPISVLTDNVSVEINSDQLRISSNVTSITGGLTGGSGVPISVLTDNVSMEINSDQIRVRSGAVSGSGGMTGGSGSALSLVAGDGITVNADDIATSANQSHITTIGTLGDLTVTGNTTFNTTLQVQTDLIATGNLEIRSVAWGRETIEYSSVVDALNRIGSRRIHVTNTEELINGITEIESLGGELHLGKGEFTTNNVSGFVIPKNVTLIGSGENQTVIRKDSNNVLTSVLKLQGNNVVKDLTIDCNSSGNSGITGGILDAGYGIDIESSVHNRIQNINLKGLGERMIGIYSGNSSSNVTSDLEIHNVEFEGALGSNTCVYGYYTDIDIKGSQFSLTTGRPIEGYFSNVILSLNKISGSQNSDLKCYTNSYFLIDSNEFTGTSIELNQGSSLSNVNIKFNRNSLKDQSSNTIFSSESTRTLSLTKNTFKGSDYTLSVGGTNLVGRIQDNLFSYNDSGIEKVINATEFNAPEFLTFSGNRTDTTNVSSELVIVSNTDLPNVNVVLITNDLSVYRQDPVLLKGYQDKILITTTTSVSCVLENLSRESKGHKLEIKIESYNGDFTLTPESCLDFESVVLNSKDSSIILEWTGTTYKLRGYKGVEFNYTTNTSNTAVSNIDTISTTSIRNFESSNTKTSISTFTVRPNTTVTKTEFNFVLPDNISFDSANKVVSSAVGYTTDNLVINNLYSKGDSGNNRVYCSFTATGDSRNLDHIIQVVTKSRF